MKISHRKQPWQLADARVNFERPAQVNGQWHRCYSFTDPWKKVEFYRWYFQNTISKANVLISLKCVYKCSILYKSNLDTLMTRQAPKLDFIKSLDQKTPGTHFGRILDSFVRYGSVYDNHIWVWYCMTKMMQIITPVAVTIMIIDYGNVDIAAI